jgi:beta-lactamase class A
MAGVYAGLPDGTTLFEANPGESIESASLYKLPIVVEVFRLRDTGAISFDQQIELRPEYFFEEDSVYTQDWIGSTVDVATLLEHAVTLSSNVAAKALLAMAGNEATNETMRSIGLVGTEIRWSPGYVGLPSGDELERDERKLASTRVDGTERRDRQSDPRADAALNVTTAGDMGLLFRKLLNGEVFSPQTSQEILDLLSRQLINDRIPAYLPEGTIVAHKTGNLDGLVHDIGVIFAPERPVIVVCLLETWDEGYAVEVIREIAAGAYEVGTFPEKEADEAPIEPTSERDNAGERT